MSDIQDRRAREAYPFHVEIKTRFTDTDLGGHLNNVSIFVYYQDGQARFMWDCFPELSAQPGWRLRLTSLNVSYDGQTYYPDPLEVASGVEDVGNNWIRISQAMFQRGQCVGQCNAVLSVVDSQGQPHAITAEQRARLESRRFRS